MSYNFWQRSAGVPAMKRESLNQHLSQISTVWSELRRAHEGSTAAQQLLMERYGGAVYRYLLKCLHDSHAADELAQEFALCLVRGDFRGADPQRGRFRDYVKAVLFHLIAKYRARQQKQPRLLPADSPELATVAAPREAHDLEFNQSWRDELLARTWAALTDAQENFFVVLHFRAHHPDMSSAQMAAELGRQLSRPLTPDGVRQTLHRARQLFADLLLDEVAHSLKDPTAEELEQELQELNLWEYCRPALERHARSGPPS
jgi:RNA polymerase sigma-70 factor (ECF subfamily)